MPEKQGEETLKKIGYGYGFGMLIFVPAIIFSLLVQEKLFFVVSGIVYFFLFVMFFVARKQFGFTDNTELKLERKKTFVPKKVFLASYHNINVFMIP